MLSKFSDCCHIPRVALKFAPAALTDDSQNASSQKTAVSKPENMISLC